MPQPDKIKRILELRYDANYELSEAEEFVATLGEIEDLGPRLRSLQLKLKFANMVGDVEPDIVAATNACKEIKASKHFAKILEIILAIGNYMNSGPSTMPAFAFEINFLTKLGDTKDSGNKLTILHYLVDIIKRKFHDVLRFGDEIPHIDEASRVDSADIQKNLKEMAQSLAELECVLSKAPMSSHDKFAGIMRDFTTECAGTLEMLADKRNQMENSYKEVVEYFSFDAKKYPMKQFISDVKRFKELFVEACKQNLKIPKAEMSTEQCQQQRTFSTSIETIKTICRPLVIDARIRGSLTLALFYFVISCAILCF